MTNWTPADDAELVRRAQLGDRQAFASIVATYQVPSLRLATIISGDSTEAYDIVQEAFVKAFYALPRIRTSDSLRVWLLRIVANQAKNVRRSRSRRDARLRRHANLRVEEATGTDESAMSTLQAEELLGAVGRLSSADREVLACRYFADLSETETALALGLPNGTVKSRTARALTRLRSELAADVEGS